MRVADETSGMFREGYEGPVAAGPHCASQLNADADQPLTMWTVGRVAAHPSPLAAAATAGGRPVTVCYRLHGSPRTLCSACAAARLDLNALRLSHL